MRTYFIAVLSLLALCRPALGQDSGVSGTTLEFYRPAIDPYGFFGVNGPRLLDAGKFYFKFSQSFSGNHLFQIAVNGAPVDLVDKIATTSIVSSLGVTDFLTVGVDLPIHPYAREANFNTLLPLTTASLGDVRMALKFRLLKDQGKRPGLALLVTNTFPSGNELKFLGTSHMVPAAELLVGKEFKHLSLALNVGARFPQKKTVLGIDFDDQITYGAGIKIPFGFWDPLFSVIGEVRGHFQPDRLQTATAPVEFTVGLQKEFKNGLALSIGGGGAWNNAIGNPRFRGVFAISYSYRKKGDVVEPEKVSDETLHTVVYFEPHRTTPTVESTRWIHELGAVLSQGHKNKKVLVEGYAYEGKTHAQNLDLSRRRALGAKKILLEYGVEPDRIHIEALDGTNPIEPNTTSRGQRLNRRVEIKIQN